MVLRIGYKNGISDENSYFVTTLLVCQLVNTVVVITTAAISVVCFFLTITVKNIDHSNQLHSKCCTLSPKCDPLGSLTGGGGGGGVRTHPVRTFGYRNK